MYSYWGFQPVYFAKFFEPRSAQTKTENQNANGLQVPLWPKNQSQNIGNAFGAFLKGVNASMGGREGTCNCFQIGRAVKLNKVRDAQGLNKRKNIKIKRELN